MEIVGAKCPKHEKILESLGKLCGASWIGVKLSQNSEVYTIVKNGHVWCIKTSADSRGCGSIKDVKMTE